MEPVVLKVRVKLTVLFDDAKEEQANVNVTSGKGRVRDGGRRR